MSPKSPVRDQTAIESRITAMVQRFCQDFDLGWTTVTVKFDAMHNDDRVIASTHNNWEYRQATLLFSLPLCATLNDADMEDVVVHELTHILLAPLWENLPSTQQSKLFKLSELATENVSRVLSHLYRKA